jgi:hypothetical protein
VEAKAANPMPLVARFPTPSSRPHVPFARVRRIRRCAVVDLVIDHWVQTGDFHEGRYGFK